MNNGGVGGPAVRLFPEYSRVWPLWSRNMPGLDYPISPADIGISDTLTTRIKRWNDEWEKNFHQEDGWKHGFDTKKWAAEGEAIAELLEDELPGISVVREYGWCLSGE
ncbi:hypothetical protein BST20_22935 [Mycobacterium branderi]|nr:hypothetical protein BST20_22935 [Mycobacterium branderi]